VSPTLARASRRHLLRHGWGLWLSVLGVGLGVAVVVAVELANASARTALQLSLEALTGRATHQLQGGPAGIPEQVYADLVLQQGRLAAAPVVEGSVRLGNRGLTLLGMDPFAEGPFRGRLGRLATGDLRALLLEPGALALPAALAAELDLAPGDKITLEVAGQPRPARLVALFQADNPAARDTLALADLATAQELLGRLGRLDRIDLILEAAEATALADHLPPGLRLERAEARGAASEGMTRAFRTNLAAMSLLALLVGAFIIYNTMTFSVLRRRALFGQLRVLGVSRGELAALVLREALLLGLAGTLLGLLAGTLIAQGLVQLVTRTINDLYFTLQVTRLFPSAQVLAEGAAVGLLATLGAAIPPAWEAARSEPRDVQQRSRIETRVGRLLPRLALLGAGLLGLGLGLARWPGLGLLPAFAALFLVVIGFSLLVPWLLRGLCRLLSGPLERIAPPLGRLALRGIDRSLSRTGPAVAALTVAVAASVGVTVMIASFRATVELWLHQTLSSDVYVSATSGLSNRAAGTLDPGVLEQVRDLPGVRAMSRGRSVRIESRQGPVELLAIRMAAHSYAGFGFRDPPLPQLWERFDRGELILISEPFANRHGLAAGVRVELFTARGWREFLIGGVFYDYGADQGKLVLHQPLYAELWDDPGLSALGFSLQDPAAAGALLATLRQRLAPFGGSLQIRPTGEILTHSLAVFDRTFTVTRVLRLLAVGVAFVGILSALLALHLERAREHAVLRASGATPGQMLGLVTLQSGLLGLAAGLLALPLGGLLADLLIQVVNLRSFGWTLHTHIPPELPAEALLLALGAALLAGLWPAWRVARTPPAAALREE
jgi:putative ABC transport system permease protein